ncbi:hypothetical protein [uncultured Tateyamaria sp.]|uniref:hypothetical protein n=1 Tax=uncultured Tateyamaria sp. TaxID=455651 RepID=UPI00261A04BE|nr:hypothetical protein [uncultured Tateyamaria sp.]
MIQELVQQSAGAAVGVFIGTLIGLYMRKRKGKTSTGLLGGSPFIIASAAAGAALLAMMLYTFLSGGAA